MLWFQCLLVIGLVSAGFSDPTVLPPEQIQVLCIFQNLYNGSIDSKWNCSNTSNACNWYPINCNYNHTSITGIDAYFFQHRLSGTLPSEIALLKDFDEMDFSSQLLSGQIPPQIFHMPHLTRINLLGNQFEGTIPSEIGLMTQLEYLDLSQNWLISGTIPSEIGLLIKLTRIDLSQNIISGSIPTEMLHLIHIRYFDINSNLLSGTIPPMAFSSLSHFRLDQNLLHGTIPSSLFGSRLTVFDLGINSLSGSIPKQVGNFNLLYFSVGYNQLQTTIPALGTQTNLTFLDVSNNQLQGTIPDLSKLTQLRSLLVGNNPLSTTIPTSLCSIRSLTNLDLSRNALVGPLPSCISNLRNLQLLAVEYNSGLNGTLPDLTGLLRLKSLTMNANAFHGDLGPFSSSLQRIYAQDNHFNGSLLLSRGKGLLEVNIQNNFFVLFSKPDGFSIYTLVWEPQLCDSDSDCQHPKICQFNACHCKFGYNEVSHFSSNGTKSSTCDDINECSTGGHGCNASQYCQNIPGSWNCSSCADVNIVSRVLIDVNHTKFKSLTHYNYSFDYRYCKGPCQDCGKYEFQYKTEALSCSKDILRGSAANCSYPCANLQSRTALEAIKHLNDELNRGNFIQDVFRLLFNSTKISTTVSTKRSSQTLAFLISPCKTIEIPKMISVIQSLSAEITPFAPGIDMKETSCGPSGLSLHLSATDPPSIFAPIVATACTLLLLSIIGAYAYYRHTRKSILDSLPKEIAWSYQNYENNPGAWDFRGTKSNQYYFLELPKHEKAWNKVIELFKSMDGQSLIPLITNITAIYNHTLLSNFVGFKTILEERSLNPLFSARKWKNEKVGKDWVYEKYLDRAGIYPWNSKEQPANIILPVVHGTSLGYVKISKIVFSSMKSGLVVRNPLHSKSFRLKVSIHLNFSCGSDDISPFGDCLIFVSAAQQIAETGFANLSLLDAGWYGTGIYFSTQATYTIPYLETRAPAMMLSFVLPGNVFPVTEAHKGPDKLMGCPITAGFNSHYIVTRKDGCCATHTSHDAPFDELVIPQESQITPAFIIEFDAKKIKPMKRRKVQEAQREQDSLASEQDYARLEAHGFTDGP